MKEFEDMMSQMMSFKAQSANMKNEERKQKAEQLFANMFKGMMTFEWERLLFSYLSCLQV